MAAFAGNDLAQWTIELATLGNERHWSAHTSTSARNARADLVPYTPLPAETGPVWAPDRLSVWPVEGGRFGIDAHYHGVTGVERGRPQATGLLMTNGRCEPTRGPTLAFTSRRVSRAWCRGCLLRDSHGQLAAIAGRPR
jgi:hypothetical protein